MFEFLLERQPVVTVTGPFGQFLLVQQLLQTVETDSKDLGQQGTTRDQALRLFRELPDKIDEILRGAALLQPELNPLGGRIILGIGEMGFDKAADHGPIFVALGLFGLHEIGKAEQFQM